MDRLKKASKIELASSFADSKVIGQTDSIPTAVPALNIAFSGDIHGGVAPGLTMFAGESRSFKCCDGNTKIVVYYLDDKK